jgi:tetratricopeptide (TPR) repeat protein
MPAMERIRTHRRVVVDDRPLALAIGHRLRQARLAAGLTQQQLAGDRYTKAYISALENGIAKPSMAALNYLAPRLGKSASEMLADPSPAWTRVEADLALTTGDPGTALTLYRGLLETAQERGVRAGLQTAVAEALCRLDRPAEAIGPASEAARSFAELGREGDRAWAEYWLASAHTQQDNPDEARSLMRGVLDRVRAGLDLGPDFQTKVLIGLGMVATSQGEHGPALAYLEEARGLAEELDTRRRGTFLSTLARAYRVAGDLEAAIRVGLQALALLRAAESDLEAGLVENHLALAHLSNGNVGRALETVRAARATAGPDPILQSHLTDTEAQIQLEAAAPDIALALAAEALELATTGGHQKPALDALTTQARALSALGRHEEAAAAFARAAELADAGAPVSRRRAIYSAWADTLATLGRHDEAYALARRALASG